MEETVYNSSSPTQAAVAYARAHNLPIGARLEVRDVEDQPHFFLVERSARSTGMLDGGGIRVRSALPPLRGGDRAAVPAGPAQGEHILHARTQAQAALLFAKEANLPPGAYVSVESQDGQKTYFHTPQ